MLFQKVKNILHSIAAIGLSLTQPGAFGSNTVYYCNHGLSDEYAIFADGWIIFFSLYKLLQDLQERVLSSILDLHCFKYKQKERICHYKLK